MDHPGGYQPMELYTMTHKWSKNDKGKNHFNFLARCVIQEFFKGRKTHFAGVHLWNGGSVTKQATTTCRTHKKRRITQENTQAKIDKSHENKKGEGGGFRRHTTEFSGKSPCTIHK